MANGRKKADGKKSRRAALPAGRAGSSTSPASRKRTRKVPRRPVPVGIIMGSRSDWETMRHASEMLDRLGVPHECEVVSAHRTPDKLFRYAQQAAARGLKVIIAGAGGAAHLPGMTASMTSIPVLGVPVESKTMKGLDSLLSIAQMPAGIPVGSLAIGRAGAINAALLAAAILGLSDESVRRRVEQFRSQQTLDVLRNPDPRA